MIKLLFTSLFLFCFDSYAAAQRVDAEYLVDSMRADITRFFINQKILLQNVVKDDLNYVYATEISTKHIIGYDSIGIYRIGVFQSHSPGHILIKQNAEFKIIDIDAINFGIMEIIEYSVKNKISKDLMFYYIKDLMELYHYNKNINLMRKVKKRKSI